jgi:hypothetical protein
MGNRPGSFLGYSQVRTKVHRKDYGWSVGLVYDTRGLPGVMTDRPMVVGVLQMVSELTLAVSRTRTGQRRGYVHITRGSSERDTVWYVYVSIGCIDVAKRGHSWLEVDQ